MTTILIQTLRTGKPARFSANGRRISRKEYECLSESAKTYLTRAWPIEGGGTLRKNYLIREGD